MAGCHPDLVGLVEIADLLEVERQTPRAWRLRGVLPDPDYVISGTPVWRRATIERWARDTGRWPADP